MTPAENKQTVEPWAAGFRYWAMADGNPKSTWLITRETARAVVAQADRAAELEAALRDQAEPVMDERFRDRLLRHVLSNEEVGQLVEAIYAKQARALNVLAGDGGGA